MQYPVVIHKDVESIYGVTVPDLPGCFSAGETLEEAGESAQEAIACHLEGLLMDRRRAVVGMVTSRDRPDSTYEVDPSGNASGFRI